jgi:hypothetical protein
LETGQYRLVHPSPRNAVLDGIAERTPLLSSHFISNHRGPFSAMCGISGAPQIRGLGPLAVGMCPFRLPAGPPRFRLLRRIDRDGSLAGVARNPRAHLRSRTALTSSSASKF